MNDENAKLMAMLQYLEDWDKLTRTIVTHVQDYRMGLLAYQNDVEMLPDVRWNLVEDQDPVWLEVPRLRKNPPPSPCEELRPWVILFDDPAKAPEHRQSIKIPATDAAEEAEEVFFDDSLRRLFDAYVAEDWRPWSEMEKPRRQCIAFYERLFHLQQIIENSGAETPTEIIWGMGIAVWNTKGQQICHPLLTQQVEIYTEEGSMNLRVRSAAATRVPFRAARPMSFSSRPWMTQGVVAS